MPGYILLHVGPRARVSTSRRGPSHGPLSSESGTHKTVKARFWPWHSGQSPERPFDVFPLRSAAVYRQRRVNRGIRPEAGLSVRPQAGLSVPRRACLSRGRPMCSLFARQRHQHRQATQDFIRTSICDKYSGSTKITTHLNFIRHCRTASGTNWSNRRTYRDKYEWVDLLK